MLKSSGGDYDSCSVYDCYDGDDRNDNNYDVDSYMNNQIE